MIFLLFKIFQLPLNNKMANRCCHFPGLFLYLFTGAVFNLNMLDLFLKICTDASHSFASGQPNWALKFWLKTRLRNY